MTTLQEALPCPFCGKQHTLQVISGQELMGEDQEFWQHSESFGVVCDASTPDGKGGCGAMGGFKPTEDEAIEAWNTRTALAQQAEPVAYITETEQGPMVWTPEMYGEACTYCDDGEFPVQLYTAAPAPQAQDALQDIAAYIGVGGYNGATTEQLSERIRVEFDRLAALQSAQPKQEPLTDEQIYSIVRDKLECFPLPFDIRLTRAIEAAHGITGHVLKTDFVGIKQPRELTEEHIAAANMCRKAGRVSVSMVQRKMNTGYQEAQVLVAEIVAAGLVDGIEASGLPNI